MINKEKTFLEFKVTVKNPLGLHTRPATNIVKALQGTSSKVMFSYGPHTVNAKSILSLLLLAATSGSKIYVSIEGNDAERIKEKLIDVIENPYKDVVTL